MKAPLPYYKPLTGIRAVAAYLVFMHHFLGGASAIVNEFHIGVTVFFTLSGLLITSRYLDQMRLNRNYLSRYFLNRFARIYPTYFLLTCLAFFFSWQVSGITNDYWLSFLLNISFLRGFSGVYYATGVAQGWSLTVEETFYLAAPVLLYILGRVSPQRYWVVLSAFVLGSLIVGAGLVEMLHGNTYGFFNDYNLLFGYTFFGRATEFAVGAGLALVLRQQASGTLRTSSWWQSYSTVIGIIGGCCVLLGLVGVRIHYHLSHSTAYWPGNFLNNVMLPVCIAVIFYGLVSKPTWLARQLASHPMQVLGKSSYCFYLLHLGHIPQRIILFSPWVIRWPYLIQLLVLFSLTVLASLVLHYGFEEPLNKFFRRLFHKPQQASALGILTVK